MATSVSFVLNATGGIFVDWLHKHTATLPYETFPTEKGWLALQPVRPAQLANVWACEGEYVLCKNGVEVHHPIGAVLEFELTPLASERTEVTATCKQPVVLPFFGGLLAAIGKRWPESGLSPAPGAEPAEAHPGPAGESQPVAKGEPKPPVRSLRLPDYERHKAIWQAIALTWNRYRSYAKCRALLQDKHKDLLGPRHNISDKTLRRIIEEGQEGLLDAILTT